MFGFFTTREDVILSRFISSRDRVLVVGPSEDVRLDPTLLVLIMKIKNRNLFVIDKQAPSRGVAHYGTAGIGDIYLFRESVKKWIRKDPTQYFLGDAEKMPFGSGTFNVIVDRNTHYFIITSIAQRLLYKQRLYNKYKDAEFYAAETLILEYDRVLKKNGKIIFLAGSNEYEIFRDCIIDALKKRNYYVIEGKTKSPRTLRIGFRLYVTIHYSKVNYFIVGIKK